MQSAMVRVALWMSHLVEQSEFWHHRTQRYSSSLGSGMDWFTECDRRPEVELVQECIGSGMDWVAERDRR